MAWTKQQLLDWWNSQINTNGANAITGQKLNTGGVEIINAMALEGGGWEPYYVLDKRQDISVTEVYPAWQQVSELQYLIVEGISTYEFKISLTYNYPVVNKSAYFRFSIDDGVTWSNFIKEPKDTTDELIVFYMFPKEYDLAGGIGNTMLLEAAKESGVDDFEIHFSDIIVERVK